MGREDLEFSSLGGGGYLWSDLFGAMTTERTQIGENILKLNDHSQLHKDR